MGIVSTSAFAGVRATEVFQAGVNVKLNISPDIECLEDGVLVPCAQGIVRKEAPYDIIDTHWPTFTSAQNVIVPKNGTQTINPGVYNRIEVQAQGSKYGVLIMNPGVYFINEYIIGGQVLPGNANGTDPQGTVTLLVKSRVDISGASINCNVGNGNNADTPYDSPNRYVFYTEDSAANVHNASISGYMYFRYALNQDQEKMQLWGAISAESVILKNGSTINIDVDHLLFADFDAFLEIGPKLQPGWHMVKAPAEISATNIVTVNCFFGDDLNISEYGQEWIVYERDYDEVTHKQYYKALTPTTPLEKNRGYWLALTKEAELKVLGLNPIVWDKNIAGCTSPHGCYRYTLQSCSVGDTNPYIHNLVGTVGSTRSNWADYRVAVNGTVMTPTEAHNANIINKQIWKFIPNGSLASTNSGEYEIIDDQGLLSLPNEQPKIDYYNGFWVEVNCTNSIGKTIDLIVPNRM